MDFEWKKAQTGVVRGEALLRDIFPDKSRWMPFEFIQIPANGQGSAKEELNKLLRGGRISR